MCLSRKQNQVIYMMDHRVIWIKLRILNCKMRESCDMKEKRNLKSVGIVERENQVVDLAKEVSEG